MSTKTIRGKNGEDVEVVVRRSFKKEVQKAIRSPQVWAPLKTDNPNTQVKGASK
jgi:hypothetical protein